MFKHALAMLIATTIPAFADNVAASHEVRFDHLTFVCGEKSEAGKVVRFIHATPGAKYIPENELPATDRSPRAGTSPIASFAKAAISRAD